MKKVSIILGVLVLVGALNFKSLLIGSMDLVDSVGEKLNINTVRQIDFLNKVYYSIYE